MKITKNGSRTELSSEIIKRLENIECRERIVIKMPFGENINRIEIYCSETATSSSSGITEALFGDKFEGIVTLQVFKDYDNKAASKSSYSYKKELIRYIPKLVDKLYNSLKNN